jgi:predicted RNase H-like nuclease
VTDVVAGVDGCRGGWLIAMLASTGRSAARVDVLDDFGAVVALLDGGVSHLAVDMPIGLSDDGRRACDHEARARLGPRRSSVFPAPARGLLGAVDYREALARSRALTGRGISKQTFHLLPKIGEVDRELPVDDHDHAVEAHPELAFARLAGAPLTTRKRDRAGQRQRVALLSDRVGDVVGLVERRPAGTAVDDVLDALALALTARRLAEGVSERLGDGALDRRGRPMQVVC